MKKRLFGIVLVAAGTLTGQSATRWSSPQLGMVFDRELSGFSALEGVPGSVSLRPRGGLDAKLTDGWVAPLGTYALVVHRDGRTAIVRSSQDRILVGRELPRAVKAARISFSPSGTCAALLAEDRASVQVWCGLPMTPEPRREVATLDVVDAAVSDRADLAVCSATALTVWRADLEPVAALEGGCSGAVISDRLLLATRANDVVRVSEDGVAEVVAGPGDGIDSPVTLALSPDGRFAAVLHRAGTTVLAPDVSTPTLVPHGGEGRRLTVIGRNGLFAVQGAATDPLLLIDAPAGTHSIVPPGGAR